MARNFIEDARCCFTWVGGQHECLGTRLSSPQSPISHVVKGYKLSVDQEYCNSWATMRQCFGGGNCVCTDPLFVAVLQYNVPVHVLIRTLFPVPAELALITNKPRAASVHAVGDVTCAGKSHLLRFVGIGQVYFR